MTNFPRDKHAFVVEFARRTLINLDWIDTIYGKTLKPDGSASAYETTQLINSALGLILVPKEVLGLDRIKRDLPLPSKLKPIPEHKGDSKYIKDVIQGSPIRTLIYGLRNSFGHIDFETTASQDGIEIDCILFKNHEPQDHDRKRPPLWEYEMTLVELRVFVKWLALNIRDELLVKK